MKKRKKRRYTLKELIFSKNQDLDNHENGLLYEKRALFAFFHARSQLSSVISCRIFYPGQCTTEDAKGKDIIIEILYPTHRMLFIQVKGRGIEVKRKGKVLKKGRARQVYRDRGIEIFKVVTNNGHQRSVAELIPRAKDLLLSYAI